MTGELSVLNCTAGDIVVSFDKGSAAEVERAKRIIQDMLKRGYALFVHDDDGKLQKVKRFDPETCEYVIVDGPLYAGDQSAVDVDQSENENEPKRRPGRPKKAETRRPLTSTRATGIAPTSGG